MFFFCILQHFRHFCPNKRIEGQLEVLKIRGAIGLEGHFKIRGAIQTSRTLWFVVVTLAPLPLQMGYPSTVDRIVIPIGCDLIVVMRITVSGDLACDLIWERESGRE